MTRYGMIASVSALALLAVPQLAQAEAQAGSDVALLQQQLAEMRQQLNALESKLAAQEEAARLAPEKLPVTKVEAGRLSVQAPDKTTRVQFEGRFQYDWGEYMEQTPEVDNRPMAMRDHNSGTNLRRARLGISGTFASDFDFALVGEWGGSAVERSGLDTATLSYRGIKPLVITAGVFKQSGNLDEATSDLDNKFMERASGATLQSSLAGGVQREGIEIATSNDTYMIRAAVTGELYGAEALSDEQVGVTTRATFRPIKTKDMDVHLGVNAHAILEPADLGPTVPEAQRQVFRLTERPELRVDGDRMVDTGSIPTERATSWGLEAALRYKGFIAQGEYYGFNLERRPLAGLAPPDLGFDAWYVQASYILTGEASGYNASRGGWTSPRPKRDFRWGESPGAWEIAARYSVVDLNDANETGPLVGFGVRGGEQSTVTLGASWYLNRNVRLYFNYLNVNVDRLNNAGVQIGQDFDAIAIRTQFSY